MDTILETYLFENELSRSQPLVQATFDILISLHENTSFASDIHFD